MEMTTDWTSVRIRRATLQRLKRHKGDATHDELLQSLLDRREDDD